MWKLLLAILLLTQPAWAVTNQWRGGVGTNELDGTQAANLIGYNSYNHIVQPLDNLLATYCNEYLNYSSSTILTVSSGSCMVSNSQGTIRLMLIDTGTTTLTSSNLDTGALTSNTTYYVYSTAATNAATTSTYYISASSTAPSGATYYYNIGSFKTDSNTWITTINNNIALGSQLGSPTAKSSGVPYQALTDGKVNDNFFISVNSESKIVTGYSDSNSSPTTVVAKMNGNNANSFYGTMTFDVAKGNYYEITDNGSCSHNMTFTPSSK